MNALVPLALFGWIPAVLVLFGSRTKRRAVILAFILAWLFLPVVHEPILGLKWTKMRATCYGILLAVILYDSARMFAFRFCWRDLPMAVWCVCPMASSLANGLGAYDGFSQSLEQTMTWGVPYWIGRAYLGDFVSLRDLALGIVVGGLIYVPFCLIEIRVSPQWHTWIYGYFQHDFTQVMRFDGYRPVVFMEHGLAVGAWMSAASLISGWMWYSGDLPELSWGPLKIRPLYTVGVLTATTILCKSSGAIALGVMGIGILFLSATLRTRIFLILLLTLPGLYVYGRVGAGWSGMDLAESIGANFNRERAASLIFRLDNENLLIKRAMESPIFGWGGWGRARVYDDDGKDITVTDGLWIIALGDRGMIGLGSLGLALAGPGIWILCRYPPRLWGTPPYAVAAALAVNLGLFFLDGIANAMLNPIFILSAGGLNGLVGAMATTPSNVTRPSMRRPRRGQRKFPAVSSSGVHA